MLKYFFGLLVMILGIAFSFYTSIHITLGYGVEYFLSSNTIWDTIVSFLVIVSGAVSFLIWFAGTILTSLYIMGITVPGITKSSKLKY